MRRFLALCVVACLSFALCGCQAFLYPLISDKDAIEDPRVEGDHQWNSMGEAYDAIVTKVRPHAYRALVTTPEGKVDLLLQLTKIKDQTFFQLSAYPADPAKQMDDQSGKGWTRMFLTTFTSRPTYLVGKVLSFSPRLRITFFDVRRALPNYPADYQVLPFQYSHPSKVGDLFVMAPDKLRDLLEKSANDPNVFADLDFAK